MWMRFPLTVRIWGTSAVAGRSELHTPHPGAATGKAVMFAAAWVLGGLALTRRSVLNLLLPLLISPLGSALGQTPPGWCPNPNRLQAWGRSSRGTEGSAGCLNWDVSACFTAIGVSSLHGGFSLARVFCHLSKTALVLVGLKVFRPHTTCQIVVCFANTH